MTNQSPARLRPSHLLAAAPLAVALALAGCASPGAQDEPTHEAEPTAAATTEQAATTPRLAITYDGGVQVLDTTTLELVDDIELAGFNRLNPAGDERHLLASAGGGFQVQDLGTWAEPHGDHAHYYASAPTLLETTYPAEIPGHAVVHHGRTALFDDATGHVSVLDAATIADADAQLPEYTTPTPRHGVAIELADGTRLVTEGTEDARTGAEARDIDGAEAAASDECPGIHGETVTEKESVVFGCEDGALIYHDGAFTKVPSPNEFGRIGNLRAAPGSDIVLGDYNAEDTEHEHGDSGHEDDATRTMTTDPRQRVAAAVALGALALGATACGRQPDPSRCRPAQPGAQAGPGGGPRRGGPRGLRLQAPALDRRGGRAG